VLVDGRFVAAVVVLAVNDHVLKGRGPGWLTGRLSDVAGVFVAAVLAGVLLRPRLGAVVAAAGFAAVKVSPVAAELAAPLLGGVTHQDLGDLAAVVAAVPAYRLTRRYQARVGAQPGFGETVAVVASAMAVVLTVGATSCFVPPVVDGFAVGDGRVVAHIARRQATTTSGAEWAASPDGGRTWTVTTPTGQVAADHQACGGGGCWRVVPGRRVEEQAGGSWRTVFTFTGRQRDAMKLRSGCGTRPEAGFGALTTVSGPDGVHVVVAMASQGVLHRRPDGRWERRAVLDRIPIRDDGSPTLFRILSLAPLALLAGAPVVWWWTRRRRRNAAGATVVTAAGGVLLLSGEGLLDFGQAEFTFVGPVIAAVTVTVLALAVAVARRPAKPRPPSVYENWPPGGHPGGWPPPERPPPRS